MFHEALGSCPSHFYVQDPKFQKKPHPGQMSVESFLDLPLAQENFLHDWGQADGEGTFPQSAYVCCASRHLVENILAERQGLCSMGHTSPPTLSL